MVAANFGAGLEYEQYLKGIRRPARILVGSADEQEHADQFAPLLQHLGVDIPVTVVPDMRHSDMIRSLAVVAVIVQR